MSRLIRNLQNFVALKVSYKILQLLYKHFSETLSLIEICSCKYVVLVGVNAVEQTVCLMSPQLNWKRLPAPKFYRVASYLLQSFSTLNIIYTVGRLKFFLTFHFGLLWVIVPSLAGFLCEILLIFFIKMNLETFSGQNLFKFILKFIESFDIIWIFRRRKKIDPNNLDDFFLCNIFNRSILMKLHS